MSQRAPDQIETKSPGKIPGLSFVWSLLWLGIVAVYLAMLPDRVSIDSGIYTSLAFAERWHPHHLLWSWVLYGVYTALPGVGMAAVATGLGVGAAAGCAVAVGWLLQHRAGWPIGHAVMAGLCFAVLPLQLTMMAQWEAYTSSGLLMLVGVGLVSHHDGWRGWRLWGAVAAFSAATLLHQKLCLAVPVFAAWLWMRSRGRSGLILLGASGGLCLAAYLLAHRLLAPGVVFTDWLFAYGQRYEELGRIGNFASPREWGRLGWNVGAAWIPGLPLLPRPMGAAVGLAVLVVWGGVLWQALMRHRESIAFPLALLWLVLQLLILWWLPILQTMQWLCLIPGFLAGAIALRPFVAGMGRNAGLGVAGFAIASVVLHQNTLLVAWRLDHRPEFGSAAALRVAHYPYSQSYHVEVALFESGKSLTWMDWTKTEEGPLVAEEALLVDRSVVIRPAGLVAGKLEEVLGDRWREAPVTATYLIRRANPEVVAPLPAGVIIGDGGGDGETLGGIMRRWVVEVPFLADDARAEWLAVLSGSAPAGEVTPPVEGRTR